MKENKEIINSKKNSWIKPIYTLFVVAIPAALLWLFFSQDIFGDIYNIPYWSKWLIAIGFIVFTSLLTILLIYFKILEINTLAFVVPVGICFMAIFVTDVLVPWARALIVIPFIFLVIPFNILCRRYEIKMIAKTKIKNKINNEKIIGSK